MKVTIDMPDFPMLLLQMFQDDLAQYVKAEVQAGGDDVFVTFFTDDVVKAQEAIIICDKYHFAKGVTPEGGDTGV